MHIWYGFTNLAFFDAFNKHVHLGSEIRLVSRASSSVEVTEIANHGDQINGMRNHSV